MTTPKRITCTAEFKSDRGGFEAVSALWTDSGTAASVSCSAGAVHIDLQNDPLRTYEALAGSDPLRIGILLPHGTWDSPPPGRSTDARYSPYADWLITIFDHW